MAQLNDALAEGQASVPELLKVLALQVDGSALKDSLPTGWKLYTQE